MKKTKVVHIKRCRSPIIVAIDRTTIFGSRFPLSRYSRGESIKRYKEYFYARLESDPAFKAAVHKLKGCLLGCWCKPKACHGDIIVEYLEKGQTK